MLTIKRNLHEVVEVQFGVGKLAWFVVCHVFSWNKHAKSHTYLEGSGLNTLVDLIRNDQKYS